MDAIDRDLSRGRRGGGAASISPACLAQLWPLEERQLEALLASAHWRAYAAGGLIFQAGLMDLSVLIVVRGIVEIELETNDARRLLIGFMRSGDVLAPNEMHGPLAQLLRTQALVDSVVFTVPSSVFCKFRESHPDIVRILEEQSNRRWSELALRYLDCSLNRKLGSTAHFLALLSQVMQSDRISLSQSELARLLGMSRAQCTRDIHRLQALKLLRVEPGRQGITILDLEGLAGVDDLTVDL